jgi:cobalt-precorrin 5A hydrolase
MRCVVIHIDRPLQAQQLAGWLGADVMEYSDDAFEQAFHEYAAIISVMASGIAVRKLSSLIRDKWVDPAVVVVTPDMRYCIPILGGHHGGNDIARKLASHGLTPVISTATDALGKDSVEEVAARSGLEVVNKDSTVAVNTAFLRGDVPVYRIDGPAVVLITPGVSILSRPGEFVVGIGCNRGTAPDEVVGAVRDALRMHNIPDDEVLAYASTMKKADEAGLTTAVRELGGSLYFLDDDTINSQPVASRSKAELIGLIGVAEPAALALSKHKELVMRRRAYGNVTIAIAR